eukprot:7260-Heterococcus_DN1.PRE.1
MHWRRLQRLPDLESFGAGRWLVATKEKSIVALPQDCKWTLNYSTSTSTLYVELRSEQCFTKLQRAENRSKRKGKAEGSEGSVLQRRERDAKALQDKIDKKAAAAAKTGGAAAGK